MWRRALVLSLLSRNKDFAIKKSDRYLKKYILKNQIDILRYTLAPSDGIIPPK